MTFWKIRNKATRLWSKGGMDAFAGDSRRFNTLGKTWNTAGHVRNHLAGLLSRCHYGAGIQDLPSPEHALDGLEVVQFHIEYDILPAGYAKVTHSMVYVSDAADFHARKACTAGTTV